MTSGGSTALRRSRSAAENFIRQTFDLPDHSLRNHLEFQALLEAHSVVHDLADFFFPVEPTGAFRQMLHRLLLRRTLAGAARLMVVSHATGRDLIRSFRLNPARVEVVYNAIDDRPAAAAQPRRRAAARRCKA